MDLEQLLLKKPEELTEEEKLFIREHQDELTDEEKTSFASVIDNKKPEPEKVTVSKSVLDRKDIAVKNAKQRAEDAEKRALAAEQALAARGESTDTAAVAAEVKRQLAEDTRNAEIEEAASALSSNEDEKKAMIEYMKMTPSTGDRHLDAELARNFVQQKAKVTSGVSSPSFRESGGGGSLTPPSGVTDGQARLAPDMGITNDDLKKFGGEIKL